MDTRQASRVVVILGVMVLCVRGEVLAQAEVFTEIQGFAITPPPAGEEWAGCSQVSELEKAAFVVGYLWGYTDGIVVGAHQAGAPTAEVVKIERRVAPPPSIPGDVYIKETALVCDRYPTADLRVVAGAVIRKVIVEAPEPEE